MVVVAVLLDGFLSRSLFNSVLFGFVLFAVNLLLQKRKNEMGKQQETKCFTIFFKICQKLVLGPI